MFPRRQARGFGWRDPAGHELGRLIGEALGAGLAEGLETAFGRLKFDLEAAAKELAGELRSRAEKEERAFQDEQEALRQAVAARRVGCSEDGCDQRAVARGLCRKHYSSRLYFERKARKAAEEGVPAEGRRRGRRPAHPRAIPVSVAPVAPIVRRKNAAEPAPVVAAEPRTSMPPTAPSVEQVARFFGVEK